MDARRQAQQLAGMGRYGDTMLMHVNPKEVQGIASLIPMTINPQTGQPEMFIGALLGSLLGSAFLPGLAGGTWLGAAGAGAIGSALGTWAETGDLEKGIASGIMGYGFGTALGEIGSGAQVAGEEASKAALQTAAQQTPVPTEWIARQGAQVAGEEATKQQMAEFLGRTVSPTGEVLAGQYNPMERLGDIGSNLFSKNTLSALSENYLPIALGGGSLGAQEAQDQFERDMAEWRARKGKRTRELFEKYPEQISPRSPYYIPPLYGAQGGQILNYVEGGETDKATYWDTKKGKPPPPSGPPQPTNGVVPPPPPMWIPPVIPTQPTGPYANAPPGSVLERWNQANMAGLPTTMSYKSPFARSGLSPETFAATKIPQTDDAGEVMTDDDGNVIYIDNPALLGPEGQRVPLKTYMPGIDPEFSYFPGRVRSAGSITGGAGGAPDAGGGDTGTEVGAGGSGDTSLQEYINNLLATGGYTEQDWVDYMKENFPQDVDFSEFATFDPTTYDWSSIFPASETFDPSTYDWSSIFPPTFDPSTYDWSGIFPQSETFDPSTYDWSGIFPQPETFDPSTYDWSTVFPASETFDPSAYNWTDIFTQFGGGIGSQGPQGPQGPQGLLGLMGAGFDPNTIDWSSIFNQYYNQDSTPPLTVNNTPTDNTMTMQEGGQIEEDVVIVEARMAVLGQHQNPDQAIQAFIEKYGVDAFLQLRNAVLREQVPNAQTEGIVSGQGGGMDDMVNGMIGNQQEIAVSPGEYIVPSDVVSMLGDGSSDSGADRLDEMLKKIRVNKTGTSVQAEEIDEEKVLPI